MDELVRDRGRPIMDLGVSQARVFEYQEVLVAMVPPRLVVDVSQRGRKVAKDAVLDAADGLGDQLVLGAGGGQAGDGLVVGRTTRGRPGFRFIHDSNVTRISPTSPYRTTASAPGTAATGSCGLPVEMTWPARKPRPRRESSFAAQ